MAGDYGVLVANKFVLLDDDGGDPLEALQKAEVKAKKEEKPKGQVSSDKNKKVNKPTASAPEKKSDKPQGSAVKREVERPPRLQNRPPSSQGGQQRSEGERRVPRVPREGGFSGPREGFSGPRDDAAPSGEFGNRGGYRGRGRGSRGGGFGRDRAPGEADQYRKREFERHSGSDKTGVKPIVKREGGGAHNWGQSVDPQWQKDAEAAPAELDESADAGHATTGDAATEEAGGDVSAEVAAVEEGANEMTLDEWKAANEKSRTKATFNTRKPNEGHEDPKWKKMFVLKKAEDEEEEEEEEEEVEEDHVSKKNVVNIEITFGDAERRGGYGGRGGRGRGGRGGRGRGGDRYPSGAGGQQSGVPHVDDQAEFPSLGSH